MNTTPPPALPPEILLWPIDNIVPSPFQERKHFDPQPMQELADSIRINGIIQPLTVRRVAADQPMELVCGERRLRGGKMAELKEVPVILRELSDAQAENIVLTENIQREDLTPSEEARSYERLLKLRDESGKLMHTRDSVAKLASKTTNHIDDHLKLLACPKELMEAVDSGTVALSVAMVVGRIPDPKLRPAAAAKVLKPEYQQVPMNFIQARELVRQEFMVSLAKVPWSLSDADLVPEKQEDVDGVMTRCFGGDCESCPFRSGNIFPSGIPEGGRSSRTAHKVGEASANLCTLPKCHKAKLDAVWAKQKRQAMMDGLKVLDDAEAKKAFHPSRQEIANGSKYVWLDAKPEYHEVGHLSYAAGGRIWRSLLKGSEIPVIVARQPHTGLRVELALAKEAKPVAEKALRAKKPSEAEQGEKTPAELKAEEGAKKRRAAELRQEKIDKIALVEVVNDIMGQVERKGADGELLSKFFELALYRAGSDGLRFMVKHLEIPTPKKESWWNYDKDVIKLVKERCGERVAAWNGMLALVLMSWELAFNGLSADGLKTLARTLGIKLDDVQRRAKALFEAGHPSSRNPSSAKATEGKGASKNSSDPNNVSVKHEASKTKAADERAKKKTHGISGNAKDFAKAAKKLVNPSSHKATTDKGCESGASMSELVTGIADTKIGKPEKWTPADVESGAKLLKAKTQTMVDLIGSPPVRKEAIKLKNYNAVRLRLMRKAGVTK